MKSAKGRAAYENAEGLLRAMGLSLANSGMTYLQILVGDRCLRRLPDCKPRALYAWVAGKEHITPDAAKRKINVAFQHMVKRQTATTVALMGKHPDKKDLDVQVIVNRCAAWLDTHTCKRVPCDFPDLERPDYRTYWYSTLGGSVRITNPLRAASPLERKIAADPALRPLLDLSSTELREKQAQADTPTLKALIAELLKERPDYQPPSDFYQDYLSLAAECK